MEELAQKDSNDDDSCQNRNNARFKTFTGPLSNDSSTKEDSPQNLKGLALQVQSCSQVARSDISRTSNNSNLIPESYSESNFGGLSS